MKMVFTTAGVAQTQADVDKIIRRLKDSCDRFGIDLKPYGLGNGFGGWIHIKVTLFLEAAKRFRKEGYTHAFYTDGRDSIMLCGAAEIIRKYSDMDKPEYLISCEDECYPFRERSGEFPDPGHNWRYIGAGQFICSLDYAIDMWDTLMKKYRDIPEENHDQGWLQLGYLDGVLDRNQFVLDTGCNIFQCVREKIGRPLEDSNLWLESTNRIYNKVTKSWPCALHFPGGYSDPETGKDYILVPVLQRLGWL